MKRLIVTIDGARARAEDIKEADRCASREWSRSGRAPRGESERKHRRLSDEEREAKRLRTEQKKRERQAEREGKEHDRLMRRLKYIVERSEREAEKARRVQVRYKPGREPRFRTVCPRSLFRRVHPFVSKIPSGAARTAADGFRNVVLKRSCRGFGKKASGTRAYKAGEAGRAARYIARPEGIEDVEGAVLTNVIAENLIVVRSLGIEQQEEVVGFFNALEEIERATGESHVYSHLILAMPYELGPEGRAEALRDYCSALNRLNLPFSAALHKPDPEGSQRNFHAHIILGARPFGYEGRFSWSFEMPKVTDLISKAGTRWLRQEFARALNTTLEARKSTIRYSGLSQADRGVPALHEPGKGQTLIAVERADAADHATAGRIIGGAAARAEGLILRLQAVANAISGFERTRQRQEGEPRATEAPENREYEQAEVAAAAQRRRDDQQVLHRQEVEQGREKGEGVTVPHVRNREETLQNSLDEYGRYDVTPGMERLFVALRKNPPTVALAVYEGQVQVAYNDHTLEKSLYEILASPPQLAWLRRLADRLTFEHGRVPPTWQYVDMTGSILFPFRATHWARQYGGVEIETAPITLPCARGAERG